MFTLTSIAHAPRAASFASEDGMKGASRPNTNIDCGGNTARERCVMKPHYATHMKVIIKLS